MKGPGSLDIVSQGLCALRGPCLSPCFSLSSFPRHPTGHFAAEDVKAKLHELNQKWESLKSKASQRRQDLEDSLQAQQYFADANEAESWMREKEPIVGSTDYGKDEDSAEVMHTGDTRLGLGTVRRTTTCASCSLRALKVFSASLSTFLCGNSTMLTKQKRQPWPFTVSRDHVSVLISFFLHTYVHISTIFC